MKLKTIVSAALSAALTLCAVSSNLASLPLSATTTETYTLSYNLNYDGLTAEDASVFDTVEVAAGKSVTIPEGVFDDGIHFSTGWTYDNLFMFEPGDVFTMPAQDIVMEPVWYDNETEDLYDIIYELPEGAIYNEEVFETVSCKAGRPVSPVSASLLLEGYAHVGWLYEDMVIKSTDKLIMPKHNITFRPRMLEYFNVTYYAGDVDRLTGNSTVVFEQHEETTFDLADSSRFGRSGFNLVGWVCDVDGLTYKTSEFYTMPASDVTFTAVWEPKNYVVVFKSNNGKSETIKINGVTDTAIITPECTFTYEGYKFAGWQYGDTVYQAGEEFVVPGAAPGLGIALSAVWVEDNGEEQQALDSITVAQLRQQYINGEITEEELIAAADFVLGR